MRMLGRLGAVIFVVFLQGCTNNDLMSEYNNRYGPPAILNSGDVSNSAGRQRAILDALWARTTGTDPSAMSPLPPDWNRVTLAGFNVVDDACQSYLTDLWKADRQRGATSEVLTTTAAAVATIIGARAHAPGHTLAILAAAFGLGSSLNGAFWNTYLYAQNPSIVKGLVKKLDDGYRLLLIQSGGVSSPEAAYYHIREYLSLCLPPTIQAQIDATISTAKTAVDVTPPSKPPPNLPSSPLGGAAPVPLGMVLQTP